MWTRDQSGSGMFNGDMCLEVPPALAQSSNLTMTGISDCHKMPQCFRYAFVQTQMVFWQDLASAEITNRRELFNYCEGEAMNCFC